MIGGIFPAVFFLAHGAAVTSLGLALATWLRRTGLAVAVSVGAFVLGSIGWIIAVVAVVRPLLDWWSNHVERIETNTIFAIERASLALSPMGGQSTPCDVLLILLEPGSRAGLESPLPGAGIRLSDGRKSAWLSRSGPSTGVWEG